MIPLSRSTPIFGHPLLRLKLLVGQWLTPAFLLCSSSISSSSRCTACARTVFSLNKLYASYTSAYVISLPSGRGGEDVLKERLCVRDLAHVLRYVCLDSQARVCSRKCAERLQEIWSTTDGEAGCEDRLDESRVWVCG